jgi:hypothetical protein
VANRRGAEGTEKIELEYHREQTRFELGDTMLQSFRISRKVFDVARKRV